MQRRYFPRELCVLPARSRLSRFSRGEMTRFVQKVTSLNVLALLLFVGSSTLKALIAASSVSTFSAFSSVPAIATACAATALACVACSTVTGSCWKRDASPRNCSARASGAVWNEFIDGSLEAGDELTDLAGGTADVCIQTSLIRIKHQSRRSYAGWDRQANY